MKKVGGIFLIIIGAIMIIISIFALIKAFDVFTGLQNNEESYGYVFGSIVFPLLLTVFGRWVYRKGTKILRKPQVKTK